MTPLDNILKNFFLLQSDFVGIQINVAGISYLILSFVLAVLFTAIYYSIGKRIGTFFKWNRYTHINGFLFVALGYIVINTGLAVLGMFSLLHPVVFWIFIVIILYISFYPFDRLVSYRDLVRKLIHEIVSIRKYNKWIFLGVILFISISFFRLIPPESGEDAIGYHTSDPHLFLVNKSTMLDYRGPPHVLPAPHLAEMSYLVFEFVGHKDASRYLHFIFYVLVVFVLFFIGRDKKIGIFQQYSSLLFVTAPVVIQISSKANTDFQWILCWILAVYILTYGKRMLRKDVILAGIFFGGVLATKLWPIAFFPLFIIYIFIALKNSKIIYRLKMIFIFSLFALSVVFLWYLRSYILTGSPIYPAFSTLSQLEQIPGSKLTIFSYIGFNKGMFESKNLIVLSPLFYLGIIGFLLNFKHVIKVLQKLNFALFSAFLFIEYLFIQYPFGRYLLALYSLIIIPVSLGVSIMNKYFFYRIIFISAFVMLFSYYFINTLLVLSYGFGWADKDKYLTRILSRDNSSYYDFDYLFDKWITRDDLVATYGIYGFYYANFNYIDIYNIFTINDRDFGLLKKKGVTKLFLKEKIMKVFCKDLKIINCLPDRYKLIAQYDGVPRYLYLIVK